MTRQLEASLAAWRGLVSALRTGTTKAVATVTIRANIDQLGEQSVRHPDEVREVYERILSRTKVAHRYLRTRSGRRVHLIEAGEGPPVVLLHGTGTSSLSHLPLLAHLDGVRAINVDRPGFGLSEPVHIRRDRFRDGAIEFIDEVLDALGFESSALAGASGGGIWALWYALARPERVRRLALITAIPLLPGTRVPMPVRVAVAPFVGDLLAKLKPTPQMVVRFMAAMGEKDTIVRHPDVIESLVAAGRDPIAAAAGLAENRAISSPFGFRPSLRVHPDDLRRLTAPTLVIWGDHDPTGSVDAARRATSLIPNAQLEVLPAGHVPWFGHAERVAELLSTFVRSDGEG